LTSEDDEEENDDDDTVARICLEPPNISIYQKTIINDIGRFSQ
jgi:hypothetical protein